MSTRIETQQRDAELYAAYKRALQKPGTTVHKAIHDAIHTPTSRYWVGFSSVYREICARQRGYHTKHDPSSRRKKAHNCRVKMIDELYKIYLNIKNSKYYKDCSIRFIVSLVIGQPAPRFYIDFRRAQAIIEQQRKIAQQKRRFLLQ